MAAHADKHGKDVVPYGIEGEENVWQGIDELFMRSPAMKHNISWPDLFIRRAR